MPLAEARPPFAGPGPPEADFSSGRWHGKNYRVFLKICDL
jgi:hypothetical protein